MGSVSVHFVLGFLLHGCFLQLSVFGNIELETEHKLSYRFVAGEDGVCNFKVRAASDVRIEFSADYAQTTPVLEILIGGANNTKSQIQSVVGELVEQPTPALLSANEFRGFWIHWNDQAVTVGKEGSMKPIMTYEVDNSLPMKVVSVGTNGDISGSWIIETLTTQPPTTTQTPATTVSTRRTPPPVTTPKPPAKWFKTYGNHVPCNAIAAGKVDNTRIQYIGRAHYKGDLIPGAVVQMAGVCYVPWGGISKYVSNYEVLVDTKGKFVWTRLGKIPSNALPAGKTANGEVLYICRVHYKGMRLLGKAQKSLERCFVGHDGLELKFYIYEIYVY
uniref:Putative farnesoic acid o-methyltransferase-like protein n=1 Tax=Anopheles braziliensis TaxID=58242 RepID=A0A2M3YX06_9DIPT